MSEFAVYMNSARPARESIGDICLVVNDDPTMRPFGRLQSQTQLDSTTGSCNFIEIMPRLDEHLKRTKG